MKVIYIQDQEIYFFDGKYYHPKSEHFFERFLTGLGESDLLIVYTGIVQIKDSEAVLKQKCVSHQRIMYKKIPDFRRMKNLLAICSEMKKAVADADFCYLRCGIASAFAGFYCKKYHVPYMSIVNEDVFQSGINHSKIVVKLSACPLRLATRRIVKKANFACYVTNRYLQSQYPCNGQSIGCSDIEKLDIDENYLRNRILRINSLQEKIILGSIGSVSTVIKGHDIVIKTLAHLKEKGITNYVYRIVGSGNPKRLMNLADNLGVSDMVDFLGTYSHDEVLNWFDSIDIYLHPSRSEGLPRTIIEAMNRAMPCICSNVGGISELIEDAFLFYYDGAEVNKLSQLITRMDKNHMQEQAKRNFEKSKEYNPNILNNRREEFFKKAIESVKIL